MSTYFNLCHFSSSSSELLTTAKEASMLARANILYSPFRNGLKLCQIRMCFLLSMTCAAFFFLVTTDPFSNINVHYVKRQAGDSYKKAIAQLQSLRPLLPEVKVVQRQYGKAHSFKKSAVGTGCVRPTQNINDTEIMALIRSVAPLKCASQPNWIEARNGRVILKEDAVSRNGTVRCELQPFEFVDDFTARALNRSVVRYNTTVPTDFFKIECTAADGKRYTNYHATTVAKETLNQKLERVVGFDRPLNIYICGFDSVSRMTFMRKLKETYKHITQVLNGTVLEMYNIVGDGTPAALLPILTGKTEEELPETRRSQRKASFVDVYPFIWKELKRFGYATLYAEDMPSIGTYTYRLKGFKEQPTDHYLRTFYKKVESDTRVTNQKCFGSESQHRVQLSYVEDFFTAYPREQPKFAFQFHSIYSHNDFNMVELADGPTVEHLKFFQDNGFLNDTVFIVFSDHGARFSSLRRTKQGKLEERNPFVSIILPPWFKEKFPTAVSNLMKNGNRLTTPFDLHATLKSLLNFPPPKVGNLSHRGISLFSEVPASRDCANAGIAPHWCSCLSWKKLPNDALISWFIADELVKAFNKRLKKEEKLCAPLRLDSVLNAYVSQPKDDYVAFVGAKDTDGREAKFGDRVGMPYDSYTLTIRTNPKNAIYEATVLYDVTKRVLLIDLDSVSRVNEYGSASHCIMSRDSYLAICNLSYVKRRSDLLHPFLPAVEVSQDQYGEEHSSKKSAIGTGCVRPTQNINDSEMMEMFSPVTPLKCATESNWIAAKNGKVIINENVTRNGNIRCELEPFEFADDFTARTLNRSVVNYSMAVPTDFFKIECTAADGKRYTNYHATTVAKETLNRKVDRVVGFDRPLNIYICGFDSVSRMTFMRKLKETYKHITQVLNGTVLEMYNIVGDGTPAALLPILTGKTEEELPETRRSQRKASFVDVYPFIWKELKRFGYATLYAEDMPSIGTYTYRLKGFKEQPTDHYLRTFYKKVESDTRVTNQKCFGSQSEHRVQLSYVEDFFTTYPREQPKFAFQFHSIYSHNDFNMVELADGPTVEHLKFFQDNGFLNDTVFIVFSDHGARFSSLRRTKQGKLEERNPFVSIILPPWFKEKFPTAVSNLMKNGNRLTTPFDLHATLKSLLNFPPPKVGNLSHRGISLFSEVPASRDCANAGIAPHWCSCLSWKKLPNDALISWFIADELVKAFNERLKKEEKLCAPLRLDSILNAYVSQPKDDYVPFVGAKDTDGREAKFRDRVGMRYDSYTLTIRTNPANAIYEATVLYDVTKRVLLIDLDSVSRVNEYGSSSHCIMSKDSYLAIWCVCYDRLG
ncbi:hypothetical protein M513_09804 [Trichuris suis]|uniref:DUF229 domain containing protein n=3 Tax=Trichuris suis TaxID=68888 RepID=A0A085LWL1_9BILA|nr:hypothetical protein M513_09804 [Trichuris suis]